MISRDVKIFEDSFPFTTRKRDDDHKTIILEYPTNITFNDPCNCQSDTIPIETCKSLDQYEDYLRPNNNNGLSFNYESTHHEDQNVENFKATTSATTNFDNNTRKRKNQISAKTSKAL